MDSIAVKVASNKLSNVKQTCLRKGQVTDPEKKSPETERKIQERLEKESRRRESEKQKREEKYDERERQREKLRSRIRDKYNMADPKARPG